METSAQPQRILTVPEPSLVVLLGASGCGKSTFARRHFRPTEILSSDAFRAMVADSEADQDATRDAFHLLHAALRARLRRGRLTVVDATNLQPEARRPLLEIARAHGTSAAAVVLDLPEAVCLERNERRAERRVPAHVISQQYRELRRSLDELGREGFSQVCVLRAPSEIDAVTLRREARGGHDIPQRKVATMTQPEVWLRGPVAGVAPVLMPVAHALLGALEDLERVAAPLSVDELWARPGNAASVGFHLRHVAGSTDRLLTYAQGRGLDEAQRAALAAEGRPGDPPGDATVLMQELRTTIARAVETLRGIDPERILEPRQVGRARLPSTVMGLLFHAAEHAQRHTGQAIATARVVRSDIR